MTAIPPEAFDSRDCATFSCPHEAAYGDDLCEFCRRQPAVLLDRIPSVPVGLHAAIMDLIPIFHRYELEAQRRSGEDLLFARSELRKAMQRVVALIGQT